MERYVCLGSVCGWCGHVHRSLEAAQRCLEKHRRWARRKRGYSDRGIYRVEDVPQDVYGGYYFPSVWRAVGRPVNYADRV